MSDDQRPARPAEHDGFHLGDGGRPVPSIVASQDEVEAHHKTKLAANDEPAQEGDDEVEAHRHIRTAAPDNKFA